MLRLGLILYLFIGVTLAGSAMIAALVMGYDTTVPVVVSALAGFGVALPVTWLVAKQIHEG
ncbi:CTP synthetase [Roseovarius sp. SYSU LYC5161]|uniref:CTP synthetase n=1 Tax=Roseovarius halophilus (ex Wu et al. 2025) TaxID=3376060 RepID=UPI002870FB07|nr:CTP synthetase [Roseovarius sp.]